MSWVCQPNFAAQAFPTGWLRAGHLSVLLTAHDGKAGCFHGGEDSRLSGASTADAAFAAGLVHRAFSGSASNFAPEKVLAAPGAQRRLSVLNPLIPVDLIMSASCSWAARLDALCQANVKEMSQHLCKHPIITLHHAQGLRGARQKRLRAAGG